MRAAVAACLLAVAAVCAEVRARGARRGVGQHAQGHPDERSRTGDESNDARPLRWRRARGSRRVGGARARDAQLRA
jgi:hypothetical protein